MSNSLADLLDALPRDLSERVRRCNGVSQPANGAFVMHWMHNAVRTDDNPALNTAIELANRLDKPLLVYHAVDERYPFASDRHHTFMLEGARDVAGQLARVGVPYVFHLPGVGDREPHLLALTERAAVVTTDDMPTEPTLSWLRRVGEHGGAAGTPVLAVDASCVVPMPLIKKCHTRAFAFRKATARQRKERLDQQWIPPTLANPLTPEQTATLAGFEPLPIVEASDEQIAAWVGRCRIDHAVGPVPHTRGGTAAARARWQDFVGRRLSRYARDRNDALKPGVSRMSAYLHYGFIGPWELARDAQDAGGGGEKYLDELLIWRELAFQFCQHRPDHETIDALPDWARGTLLKHASDERPHLYDWETLARGRTHDEFWNAAQHSLLVQGELHNNVRMTWAKALLEWTPNPSRCLELLIDLNHRYALDGRSPASYGGLLWCLGQFDREFPPEKPITGLVRGRSTRSHARRLPPSEYAKLTRRPLSEDLPHVAVVGGGLAGLVAARTLRDHGLSVDVFDKGSCPGGRSCSRIGPGYQFDHAFSSMLVNDETDPRLLTFLDAWEEAGLLQRWDPQVVKLEGANPTPEPLDLGDYRLVGVPSSQAIPEFLVDSTLPPLDDRQARERSELVSSGVQIDRIELREGQLGGTLLAGERERGGRSFGPYDRIVLACPPENVDRLLSGLPDEELDLDAEQADAALPSGGHRMAPVWTVLFTLEHPLSAPGQNLAYRNHPVMCKATCEPDKPRRPADPRWVLHATPEWTRDHLEDDPKAVVEQMTAAFFDSIDAGRPAIAEARAHRWRFGLKRPADAERLEAARQRLRLKGLVLAGDWTNDQGKVSDGTPGWYGFPNAILSGFEAAGEILRGVHVAAAERSRSLDHDRSEQIEALAT